MSACVHEEGRIGQTHDETFPKVGDLNELRHNTSVIRSVLDMN